MKKVILILLLALIPGFLFGGVSLAQSTPSFSYSGTLEGGGSYVFDHKTGQVSVYNQGDDPSNPVTEPAQVLPVSSLGNNPIDSVRQTLISAGAKPKENGTPSLVGDNLKVLIEQTKSFHMGDFSEEAVGAYAAKSLDLDVSNPDSLPNRIINLLARTIGTFAVFGMVLGGYYMLISNGDQNEITKGKNILIYSVIGLLITFLSVTIVKFVASLFITVP